MSKSLPSEGVMMKSLEELKNEMASVYANKHGIAIAKKVKVFTVDLHLGNPQQYDYEYSKNIIAEYAFMAGFDAAIKAASEREKTINEKEIVDIITEWKHFWMNQTQNNQQDYENYFRRASGIDANMKYNLAKRICEALKDYRGMKNGKIE